MGKIPEHFRGPAASRRTGITSPDQSGVIISQAVRGLADTFFSGVAEMEARSKQLVDKSTRAKAVGSYTTQYLEGANQIKRDNIDNPEEAVRLLAEFRLELKNEHITQLTDQGLQQEFAFDIDNINIQEDIRDVAYKIEQSGLIAQKNYTDRISDDAKTVAQTPSYEEYLKKIDQFQSEETNGNNISQAFGGLKEGQKVLDQGMEAMTRGFISGKLARGESFEAAQHLIRGDFDPFVTPEVKAELLKKIEQGQKGEVKKSEFIAAAEAAVDIFRTSKDVFSDDIDVVALEEKISQTSFALLEAQQGGSSEAKTQTLTKQLNLLERIRDVKLEEIETTAVDDPSVKGDLLSDYQFLVDYEDGQNSLIGTLDEVLDFQRKATEKFHEGKISRATYDKWMLFTETAIENDITEGLKEKREGFKISGKKLSSSKKVRKRLKDILQNSNKRLGREHAVDTLDFYMDMLNDQLGGDLTSLDNMTDGTHDELVKQAKARASLKKLNLPVYLTVGNKIPVNGIAYDIVGFDDDGMPQVEVKQ